VRATDGYRFSGRKKNHTIHVTEVSEEEHRSGLEMSLEISQPTPKAQKLHSSKEQQKFEQVSKFIVRPPVCDSALGTVEQLQIAPNSAHQRTTDDEKGDPAIGPNWQAREERDRQLQRRGCDFSPEISSCFRDGYESMGSTFVRKRARSLVARPSFFHLAHLSPATHLFNTHPIPLFIPRHARVLVRVCPRRGEPHHHLSELQSQDRQHPERPQ